MFLIAVVDMDLMRNSSRYKTADIDSRIRSHFHSLSPDTYSFFLSFFLHFFPSFSLPLFISFFLSFFISFYTSFLFLFLFPSLYSPFFLFCCCIASFSFSHFIPLCCFCFKFDTCHFWPWRYAELDSIPLDSNPIPFWESIHFVCFGLLSSFPPPSINCQVNFPSLVWGSEFGRVDTKEGGN